jgi:hypothetical protein
MIVPYILSSLLLGDTKKLYHGIQKYCTMCSNPTLANKKVVLYKQWTMYNYLIDMILIDHANVLILVFSMEQDDPTATPMASLLCLQC